MSVQHRRAVLMFVFLLVGSPPAWAAGDPCARFKDADAYNSCLAASGPTFHQGHFRQAPQAAPAARGKGGRRHPRVHPRVRSRAHSHGRVRITIYPGQ